MRVLNLGGREVDIATPMESMVFTVMAALAQMELVMTIVGVARFKPIH